MTWVDLSAAFAYGSQLTSTQMQNLRDNIAAMAAGDAGAPEIETAGIADNAINAAKIAAGAVGTSEIATNGVDTAEIAAGAVDTTELAADAVTGAKIENNAVDTEHIASSAVDSAELATGAVTEAKLGASSVDQTALKTSTGSVNVANSTDYSVTLPGGTHGFYPNVYMGAALSYVWFAGLCGDNSNALTGWTSGVANISLSAPTGTIYALQRYVTASGEVFWIFILKDKNTGQILAKYQAPDHPCMGNGGDPELISHPFRSYDPNQHEIIVINPSAEDLGSMRSEIANGKCLLHTIDSKFKLDESVRPDWPTKEVTVGLPADWDEAWLTQRKVTPIKMAIPKPEMVKTAKLIRK